METERRRQLLLSAIAIGLGLVVYQSWPRTSAAPAPASNERRAAAPATPIPTTGTNAATPPGTPSAPDVHLDALDAERPKPGTRDRNLFRFRPKAPPPPPPGPAQPMQPAPIAPAPTGPPPPPPVAPITLKFIGVIDEGRGRPKVAVLSDGVGPPFSAREGEPVAGRYRILKIGVESIEIAYLDGRGRQTIRLSGS